MKKIIATIGVAFLLGACGHVSDSSDEKTVKEKNTEASSIKTQVDTMDNTNTMKGKESGKEKKDSAAENSNDEVSINAQNVESSSQVALDKEKEEAELKQMGKDDERQDIEKPSSQVLVKNKKWTISYEGLKIGEDDILGKNAQISLNVTNHTKKTIMVQLREVSIDDKMLNQENISYSEVISPKKTSTHPAMITYTSAEDEFPAFKKTISGKLVVMNEHTWKVLKEIPFTIKLNS